jgi:hypothetical protein
MVTRDYTGTNRDIQTVWRLELNTEMEKWHFMVGAVLASFRDADRSTHWDHC